MSFTVQTFEELHEFLVAHTKALFPGNDVSRGSFPWLLTRVYAGGVADNNAFINATRNDLMPDTAEGEWLTRWGTVLGVTRKSATPGRKANALRIRGTAASTVTTGDLLTHESGLQFQINENETIPAAGYVDVDVLAIDTGSATLLGAGEILTFDSAPSGIEETAELQIDIDEDGDDAESDGAYRTRILARLSTPPLGGAQSDYVAWATAVTGVAAAYAYPNRAGYGTVDLAALHGGSGSSRLLSAGEISDLQDTIDDLRPVGMAGFRVLTVVADPQTIEVTVMPNGESQYEFDWDDTSAPVVSTWNSGTRTITFSGARPDTMAAGGRFVIDDVAGLNDGRVYTIESLSSTNAIVVEEAPDPAPVATDVIRAAGPLTDAVRDAIQAHVDSLGTANPDATSYGAWDGNLRLSTLYKVINVVPGVLDSTITTPVANVEADDPTYPDDDEISLITAARILVVKQ